MPLSTITAIIVISLGYLVKGWLIVLSKTVLSLEIHILYNFNFDFECTTSCTGDIVYRRHRIHSWTFIYTSSDVISNPNPSPNPNSNLNY